MREKFHRRLKNQLPASSTLQMQTLHTLVWTVFDFLAHFRDRLKLADKQFEPLFEVALQQELYEILFAWMKNVSQDIPVGEEVRETTALVISWAIFGPAAQWSRGDRTTSAEEMTHRILSVVIAGLSPIVTVT